MHTSSPPPTAAPLHDPAFEHDACGVAFVARLHGGPSREVVERGIAVVENLFHRGAQGADPETGDGSGILLQIPDAFLRAVVPFDLPAPSQYGVAMCFLPRDAAEREPAERHLTDAVEAEGQRVLGWRDVPVRPDRCGEAARAVMPHIRQLFVAASDELAHDHDAFERKLYLIRRVATRAAGHGLYVASFSSRTINYKGMLTSLQLADFFPDLRDESLTSRVALVHSRFSTNTFPSWPLAHPYRLMAHNGEINTLMGNVNWMRARQSQMRSELFGDDLAKVMPVVGADDSDSATFDNALELLALAGRSLPHVLLMMMPEAWENNEGLPDDVRGFYEFHACKMEPWDGPAAIAFTDGRVVGATLDRNGLRPGRWLETRDGYVVMASETGVLPIPEELVVRKGRLHPGRLLLVDLEAGRVVEDDEIKRQVAAQQDYRGWVDRCSVRFDDLPEPPPVTCRQEPRRMRQLAFGYSQEDLKVLLAPMAATGQEPLGSMGNDIALSVLSDRQPPLFSYFKQRFAQVTNPPIDPIRETIVMSLGTGIGAEGNLLDEAPEDAHQLVMRQPILRDRELEKLRHVSHDVFRAQTLDITWPAAEGPEGMERALARVCERAQDAIAEGTNIVILSDRDVGPDRVPIPSLLATGAVHHHLVREGTRLRAGLVVESGEPREVHHVCTLIGYGASAVSPYLMLESLEDLREHDMLPEGVDLEEAECRVVKALGKGILKVLSKMGISTVTSYCGAQIFEAVGLEPELVDRCFTRTASRIGGVGIEVLAREALERHARGYPQPDSELLPPGGLYMWRRDGERRMWDPETIALLQHSVRSDGDGAASRETYDRFARLVNEENARHGMLRGLLRFREDVEPIPLDDVEPASEIVKHISTGGMSLGALSPEAHETLAVAMNHLGGMSNTGEGGEDESRYHDERRSAIKQVASGRFGVTINYLVNADQLQIKIAQGAKPGEGGQLPGHKVDRYIAKLRHSTPGVGLISPPPHHDIYSIEDLKQLIYDLRCANPRAKVSVKLVAEVGVGTVAAGVAKANADHVTIAGHDGGTGASPQSSIQSAGVPWEIGLAETQQTLLANDLRSRIIVEADGQMRTGRDLVVAALLGADEYGFSTAPLIALGCIMMRVCHLNTCPVGIASQDPELRKRFAGKPEHVVTYLWLVAEEARQIMASLGVPTMGELIGRADLLVADEAIDHWKARGVDLSGILTMPECGPNEPRCRVEPPPPVLDDALDWELIEVCKPAIEGRRQVRLERQVRNVNRTVGGLMSSRIASLHGSKGLPDGAIEIHFRGSAGQSFGAWLAPGVTFVLQGDANDYIGKGLSGGVLAVRPPDGFTYAAEDNVIVGNVALYGATGGRAFFRGLAGERFAVRNSDAWAVVEGVGDHGCEYMTGGRVVVLGPTGWNFAAGMSGGIAYVLDHDGSFGDRCNMELVGFDEISPLDKQELQGLIAEHLKWTGSPVAERVLANWDLMLPRFVKVMPHDYKRALAELARDAARVSPEGEPAVSS
jgi:glutamate synthase domain-containing protein 2/glutamate synthase domain-containing protein 1/glutamate synthase domain-containing protein 3